DDFLVQAEDGIRDATVTGVQTCALPICCSVSIRMVASQNVIASLDSIKEEKSFNFTAKIPRTRCLDISWPRQFVATNICSNLWRSEERRVGKGGRSWLVTYQ